MFTFIYRKPSDCIISSNHPNRPTVLFRPIIQIVRPYYFVRLYYFLRSSNLPFNVQFSSSYFALFLYLNTNLIQIKSRTRTFPETATRSLRPRRTYCNTAQNSHTSRNICQCTECSICVYMYSNKHSKNKIITRIALVCVLLKPNC